MHFCKPEFTKVSQTLQDSQSGGLEKSAWPTTISPDAIHENKQQKKKIYKFLSLNVI